MKSITAIRHLVALFKRFVRRRNHHRQPRSEFATVDRRRTPDFTKARRPSCWGDSRLQRSRNAMVRFKGTGGLQLSLFGFDFPSGSGCSDWGSGRLRKQSCWNPLKPHEKPDFAQKPNGAKTDHEGANDFEKDSLGIFKFLIALD